jgi:6-pyruvoyltetrahydropterin/6-carboxytetrahydropterin synthase
MYTISKEIDFCYGHRLLNHAGKCKYIHGHSAKAVIYLASPTLNIQGMVCDFTEIGQFAKEWIEQEFDHTLLLHQDDPLLPLLRNVNERCKSLDCHPTAENIARLIYEVIANATFPVLEVKLYETTTSSASYMLDLNN